MTGSVKRPLDCELLEGIAVKPFATVVVAVAAVPLAGLGETLFLPERIRLNEEDLETEVGRGTCDVVTDVEDAPFAVLGSVPDSEVEDLLT